MHAFTGYIKACLALTFACLLTGGLAALTVNPPHLDLAIWPPAGIGFATLCIYGRRLWPGVWLSSFIVFFPILHQFVTPAPVFESALISAILSSVTALQTVFAVTLVRMWIGSPLRLIHLRDIGLFLLIAGPLQSFPSMVVGTTIVCSYEIHPWSAFGEVAISWWWNEIVGGMLFAIITLTIIGQPRELWRVRRVTVAVPLLLLSGFASIMYVLSRESDDQSVVNSLIRSADLSTALVTTEVERLTSALEAQRNIFGMKHREDADIPSIRARSKSMRRAFPFVNTVALGNAEQRDGRFHATVSASAPSSFLPFEDATLDAEFYSALGESILTGQVVSLYQPGANGLKDARLVLIMAYTLPANQHDGDAPMGFLACQIDPALLVNHRGVSEELRIPNYLTPANLPGPTPRQGTPTVTRSVWIGARPWTVTLVPDKQFLDEHRTNFDRLAVLGAVLISVIATVWLLAMSGRAAAVNEEVAFRTAELAQQVAARELTEAALRASEARLAEAQSIARLGYWEWDPLTGDTYWYGFSDDLLGSRVYGEDEPNLLNLIHPDDRQRFETVARSITGSDKRAQIEFRIQRSDGQERWAHAWLQSTSADGFFVIRGTLQDVTERVLAERDRREFDERIQHTQKLESLGVLAGGIAHDFNNLLTGILGNASLAREAMPPQARIQEYLRPIEQAATHAASLCQQMLAYAGQGVTVRGEIDLNRLILDTGELLKMSASQRVDLVYELDPTQPVLEGDPGQIRQILLNLVSNASEAIGDVNGKVTVVTGRGQPPCPHRHGEGHHCQNLLPGEYVWIEVRDTGCGMPPEVVEKIFEPFYTTKFTGRGLGLSAVHGVARTHGGAVCVTSQQGVGTTFRVYLVAPLVSSPYKTPPVIVHTPLRIPAPISRQSNTRSTDSGLALITDDEPVIRQLGTIALQGLGFEVLAAENGADALRILEEHGHEIQVLVLDMMMPIMDGKETLKTVRQNYPDLPVILMSGYSESDIIGRVSGVGNIGFLQKPFRPSDLVACVRSVTVDHSTSANGLA